MMKTKLITQKIIYDGSQLRSHWIYEQSGLLGDVALAFCGPCDVKLASMVDLVDVRNEEPIYSESMLHFIVELFDHDLKNMVWIQRYFLALLYEELLILKPKKKWLHHGDDIYLGDKKLSVSIATLSPVSSLMHLGVNISSKNTPVATVSLQDLKIDEKKFARKILSRWSQEFEIAQNARVKVRNVL